MIVLSFETEKDQQAILDKAIEFVTLSQKDEKIEVKVESREFEHWAKKFVKEF